MTRGKRIGRILMMKCLSQPLTRGTFMPHKKKAVMGPSLAPFSDKRAAEDFRATNGGKLYRFEDITTDILGCRAHN